MGRTDVTVRALLPGFTLLVALAISAELVADQIPYVNELVLAVAFGSLIGNLFDLPVSFERGLERHDLLLETGIVLLGASVPLGRLVDSGRIVVVLVLASVAFGIVFVESLGRWVRSLTRREGTLLAAGASICGVSAVVAVGRSIDADRKTLAYVAGAVLLFDAVTLVVFPILGGVLHLPDRVFGVWAGLSMFSTGPVAAAGFAVSPEAGRWATLTKLARNALIGVVAVGYATAYARRGDVSGEPTSTAGPLDIWEQFPKFLVGFGIVTLIVNSGVVTDGQIALIETTSAWLFALGFVGVGYSIRVREMRSAGFAPLAVLLAYLLVVSSLALLAVRYVLS